jgi:hypothetical protein
MTDHTDDLEPLAPLAWPPPPNWPSSPPLATPPPEPVNPALFGPPAPEPPPPLKSRRGLVTAVIVAMLIAGIAGFGVTRRLQSGKDFNQATQSPSGQSPSGGGNPGPSIGGGTGGSSAPKSTDPNANALSDIVIRQRDVIASNSVSLIPNGDETQGTTTLDLCNGTFPSESLRTARLQVAEVDDTLSTVMSTEAVLYKNNAATAQAFRELAAARTDCPRTPVPSKSSLGSQTTTFNTPPDRSWPKVNGVERQAYDFTLVDELGDQNRVVTVYLRRGRALLALYYYRVPDPQPAVDGKTTMESVTHLFEQRMAALPDAAVNHP